MKNVTSVSRAWLSNLSFTIFNLTPRVAEKIFPESINYSNTLIEYLAPIITEVTANVPLGIDAYSRNVFLIFATRKEV